MVGSLEVHGQWLLGLVEVHGGVAVDLDVAAGVLEGRLVVGVDARAGSCEDLDVVDAGRTWTL